MEVVLCVTIFSYMDDTRKRDENYERRDRPAVRFETVVETPEEPEEPQRQTILELPHRMPPEMPRNELEAIGGEMPDRAQEEIHSEEARTDEVQAEEVQGSRFDELARALGNGGVEVGTAVSNKRIGKTFSWGWTAFLLIFIFGAGLGMAGGYVMWGKQFEVGGQPSSSLTDDNTPLFTQNTPKDIAPTPVVVSTPSATSDRAAVVLQILNGSGTVGAASDMKDYLEGLGYKGISAGNASRSDYEETKISIKDSKKALLQMIVADLGKKVSVSTVASTLSETSGYDAIVTLGKK